MKPAADSELRASADHTIGAATPTATVRIRYVFRSRVMLPRPRCVVSYNQVIEVPADVAAELLALGPDHFVLADEPPAAGIGPGPAPDPNRSAPDPVGPGQPARRQDALDPTPDAAIPPTEAPSTPR